MKDKPYYVKLDISWHALFKVVLLGVGLYALILLRDILIMLAVVFVFVAAVNPTIMVMQRHMSRTLAVSLFYTVGISVISLVSYLVIPTLVHQLNELVRRLPDIADTLRPSLADSQYAAALDQTVTALRSAAGHLSDNLLQTTYGFFGSVAITVSGLALSFYLLLEEKNAREFFHQILPQHRFRAVYQTVSKISTRMGLWVRGEAWLMLIIGGSYLIVYLLAQTPSPLPLALWAGICELIPVVGALLGIIPAIIVSLTTYGGIKALIILTLSFVVIQQVEAHIIVPKVMGKAVGLSPVLVIISLLVGAQLFGFIGAVMAVPSAAVISVIIGEWPSLRRIWEEGEDGESE